MSNTESEYEIVDPKDAHVHVCACGKVFDWHAETTENAIQAAKVELLEELREAMVVQQNNPWGIKLINTELSKLRSEK